MEKCSEANTCRRCGKSLKSRKALNRHLKVCKAALVTCPHCHRRFGKKGLCRHIQSCKKVDRSVNRTFKCRVCSDAFPNRRDLYYHSITQHGRGDGQNNVENFQLQFPPWEDDEGNVVDQELERVYNDNAVHINAPHRRGEVVQNYNFPTENLQGGVDEIMSHIEDIYQEQTNSFRLNMSFGFILRNRQTGEYRYYIPYTNSYLFNSAYPIVRHGSLRALRNKIKHINPEKYLREHNPNSKWEVVYVTNIRYNITLLDYLLGYIAEVPKHVKDAKSIHSLTKHPATKQPYNDNLCFFRCLAYHRTKTKAGLDVLAYFMFQQWVEYSPANIDVKNFLGVNLHDIPDLENCFQTNLNVFQLFPN